MMGSLHTILNLCFTCQLEKAKFEEKDFDEVRDKEMTWKTHKNINDINGIRSRDTTFDQSSCTTGT